MLNLSNPEDYGRLLGNLLVQPKKNSKMVKAYEII